MIHQWPSKKIAIEKINPAPYNPRAMSDQERKGLKASLARWGLAETLVWNKRTGYLVGGHQRFYELRDDGAKQVWVTVVDLDEHEERALNLVLNNPGLQGHYIASVDNLVNEVLGRLPDLDAELFQFDKIQVPRIEIETPVDDGAEANKSGNRFDVIVQCSSESAQQQLVTALEHDGYKCRALTS